MRVQLLGKMEQLHGCMDSCLSLVVDLRHGVHGVQDLQKKNWTGGPEALLKKLYANDGSLFKSAETLLNVQAADKIDGGRCKEVIDAIARPVYKALQIVSKKLFVRAT